MIWMGLDVSVHPAQREIQGQRGDTVEPHSQGIQGEPIREEYHKRVGSRRSGAKSLTCKPTIAIPFRIGGDPAPFDQAALRLFMPLCSADSQILKNNQIRINRGYEIKIVRLLVDMVNQIS